METEFHPALGSSSFIISTMYFLAWLENAALVQGKLLGLGVAIQLLGQLAGMNVFMFDGPLIFSMIFQSDHAGRLFTVVAGWNKFKRKSRSRRHRSRNSRNWS